MAINQYTKPTEHRVQKTQVLPRTELLLSALEQRQGQYDAQLDKLSEAQGTISNYQVVGDYAKAVLKVKEDMLTEASSNLLKEDLSDRSVQGKVNKLIGSIADDEELKKHVGAAESYKKYMEQYENLAKTGKIQQSSIYFQELDWQRYKKTGQVTDRLSNPIIPEQVDVVSARQNLVKLLEANGSEAINYLKDGHAYKTGYKGVDAQRVIAAVDGQLNTYIMSPAGQQDQRDYLMKVHMGAIDPSKLDMANYIRQEIWGTVSPKVHSQTTTNIDGAINASLKAKKEKEESIFPASTAMFESIKYPKNTEFDEKGQLKGDGLGFAERFAKEGIYEAFMGAFTDNRLTDANKIKYAPIIAGAKANGVTPAEYYKATNQNGNVEYNMFTKDSDSKNWGNLLFSGGAGNIMNLEVINEDGKKRGGREGIANMLGLSNVTAEELNNHIKAGKFEVKALGFAKPSEHTAYGMVVSANGKNSIVDISHLLKTDYFKPEKKYELLTQHATALAESGIPTPTTVIGDNGKPVEAVLYKNIKTGKVEALTKAEFDKKVK
jgi:hypothetical protein